MSEIRSIDLPLLQTAAASGCSSTVATGYQISYGRVRMPLPSVSTPLRRRFSGVVARALSSILLFLRRMRLNLTVGQVVVDRVKW